MDIKRIEFKPEKFCGQWRLFILLFLCGLANSVVAGEKKAMLIYPDVKAPFKRVYSNIIDGVKAKTHLKIDLYTYSDSTSEEDFIKNYEASSPDILIVLGRKSYRFIKSLRLTIPVIVSAVFEASPEDTCVCMNTDPEVMFSRLVDLRPGVKKVYVVYNPVINSWMISKAFRAAKKTGLKLIARKANSQMEAAQEFKKILSNIESQDSVWLPVDSIFPDTVMLPEILQSAWDKKFAVFSTSPAYVKRGGLFALYPDNVGLGQQVASLTMKVVENKSLVIRQNTLLVKSAINVRTGRHLGFNIDKKKLDNFDVIFPVQ